MLHALQCGHWKKLLADLNLAVSTPTAKPPNLIPHQIFRLYVRLISSLKRSDKTISTVKLSESTVKY